MLSGDLLSFNGLRDRPTIAIAATEDADDDGNGTDGH